MQIALKISGATTIYRVQESIDIKQCYSTLLQNLCVRCVPQAYAHELQISVHSISAKDATKKKGNQFVSSGQ